MQNESLWRIGHDTSIYTELATPLDYVKHSLDGWGADARRLFHGRGGILEGWKHVSVDWYTPALFVTLYEESDLTEGLLREFNDFAQGDGRIACFAVQRRYLSGAPVEVGWGCLPEIAYEGDLKFGLSLDKNQNHGFFPDMSPGREWIRENASGKRVLNLFSYTCALSVAAVAGGAREVVNLDQSSRALSVGRENHRLNFDQATCRRVSYLAHDLFKSWGRLKRQGPYDLVVLDPPSHQPGSFVALKDYPRMLRRLPEILTPSGADILVCLNAPELDENFITDLLSEHLPEAELVMRLADPPGYLESGEEWGLKRLVYRAS